jgi:hypothetical protein
MLAMPALAQAAPVTLECTGKRLDRHVLKGTLTDMPRKVTLDLAAKTMRVEERDGTLAGKITSITPTFVFGTISYVSKPPVVNGVPVLHEKLMIDRWTGAAGGSRHPQSGEDLGRYNGVCLPPGREPITDFTDAMKKGTLVPEGASLF